MRRSLVMLLFTLALAACQDQTTSVSDAGPAVPIPSPRRLGAANSAVDRFSYLTGSSGTVTIAAGFYVTGIAAHAASAGTLVITPWGPSISDAGTGPSIPIPAGSGLGVGYPMIAGGPNELGGGTVLVFTGTDSYLVTLAPTGT